MMTLTTIDTTPNAEITPVGVRFADTMSIDEWSMLGERLERADRGLRWIIGDWLVFGSERFGARAAIVADSLSLATGSVANAASVCRRVPFERRRPELSFSHHEEVAHLADDDQVRMLATAVDEGLSKSVLRQLVHEEEQNRRAFNAPPVDDKQPDDGAPPAPRAEPARPQSNVETVVFRIVGTDLDAAVLADGVARVREGLQVWLSGHGVDATVEIET